MRQCKQENFLTATAHPSISLLTNHALSILVTIIPPVNAASINLLNIITKAHSLFHFAPAVELPTHHWSTEDPRAELLQWHNCLGHTSFPVLKLLAELGEIPKSLAKVSPPFCAGYQFGSKTRKPWWTKTDIKSIRTTTKPG